MSLFWPPDVATNGPRLHALVVGVGAYPHLSGGEGAPTPALSTLGQLASPVPTALHVARWLAEDYTNDACPLGSVELLLSPAQDADRPGGDALPVEAATEQALREAAARWFERCDTREDNVAFFYFSGHGLQGNRTTNQLLLPADIGDSAADPWGRLIDFDKTRLGMRRCKADTQLFFVDACNEYSMDTLEQLDVTGRALVSGGGIGDRVRTVATYRAAREGRQAFAPTDGELTYFAQTLFEALGGIGATLSGETGTPEVNTHYLGGVLAQLKHHLFDAGTAAKLSWHPDPDGELAVIHRPPAALVRTTLRCDPEAREPDATFRLARGSEEYQSPRGEPRPWVQNVRPGDWTAEAAFSDASVVSKDPHYVGGTATTIRL